MSTDATLTDNADAPHVATASETLVSTVVEYDDESDECTIYPLHADDEERVTTWVSAKRESYVSLAEMR
ncbi:hypothetical protein NDI76_14000 [Halogeometricum sp. S1BR25-6]|uniref:DUF7511 domain-containing protein n=1 Tax=Halogeometricum salsisoli TaxID=2950536 RepID=A0ABU2GGC3_9EURY|nr:hypothetical protein [Halogeometricum sp. S1BR25-6]MDS0299857.1 hypothetical protein [Halogeometricum sp. S1BR25-6]